jgi:hypothetical protein
METNIYSALNGLFYFFIISSIFFIFKFTSKDSKTIKIISIIYILLIVIGEYFINLSVSKQLCETNQYKTAIYVTIIPWIFIFGILNMMLLTFPGWLVPFSNTFGYLITKLAGIDKLLNTILVPKITDTKTSKSSKAAYEALEHIYSDKSLLINEITQSNFERFWEQMTKAGLFKIDLGIELKEKLFSFVKLKDDISLFIWYMLTGALITSVSYNYIINNGCKKTSKEMMDMNKDYINKQNEIKTQQSQKTQPRIYSTNE